MAMILLPQSLVLTVNSLIYKTRAKRELGYISAYCIKFTINSFDSEWWSGNSFHNKLLIFWSPKTSRTELDKKFNGRIEKNYTIRLTLIFPSLFQVNKKQTPKKQNSEYHIPCKVSQCFVLTYMHYQSKFSFNTIFLTKGPYWIYPWKAKVTLSAVEPHWKEAMKERQF